MRVNSDDGHSWTNTWDFGGNSTLKGKSTLEFRKV